MLIFGPSFPSPSPALYYIDGLHRRWGLWVVRVRESFRLSRILGIYCKTLEGVGETGTLWKWIDSLVEPGMRKLLESREFKGEGSHIPMAKISSLCLLTCPPAAMCLICPG